jgi:hypothetical protein
VLGDKYRYDPEAEVGTGYATLKIKRRMRKMFFIFLAPVLAVSCSRETSFSETERSTVRNEVTETLHNYAGDVSAQGLKAELAYLDSSEDFFWVPPGYPRALDFDSVAEILTRNAPVLKSIHNRYDRVKVVPLCASHAVYSARVISEVTDTSGKTTSVTLLESGVLIKRGGRWKLLGGQTSRLQD